MRARFVVSVLTVLAGVGLARDAAAGSPHFPEQWYLPIGGSIGGVARKDGSGLTLGAEASVVDFPISGAAWAGGYVDVIRDFGVKKTRFSLGPELGWGMLGADFGVALQTGDGRHDVGWTARVLGTLGVAALYLRTGSFPGADDPRAFLEVGALFKFPIQLTHWVPPKPPEPPQSPPPKPPPPPPGVFGSPS